MPLYDYRCDTCSWFGEDFQTVDSRHTTSCPECGSAAALQFCATRHIQVDPKARKQKLKDRGLIELGDEHPAEVAKMFDSKRESIEAKEDREFEQRFETEMERMGGPEAFVTSDPSAIRQAEEEARQDGRIHPEVADEDFA